MSEDAAFVVPVALRGWSFEEIARRMERGSVTIDDIETVERLCQIARHKRYLLLAHEHRLPCVCPGRMTEEET